jgi:hypothetical protein
MNKHILIKIKKIIIIIKTLNQIKSNLINKKKQNTGDVSFAALPFVTETSSSHIDLNAA